VIGRFMAIDAAEFDGNNLHSFNRYAYANNNPYRFVDPDGNSAWTKAIKLVLKGGDLTATFADAIQDVGTVLNPNASRWQRIGAGLSLLSELAPVSVSDLKDVRRLVKPRGPSTTVLGNGQTTRVVPFAERTGARTLDNGLTEAQWNALTPRQQWRVNDGQLRRHINAGDQFRDIGPDGLERTLDLRRAELLRLSERGVPVERVSTQEVRKVLGQ
jgi:hypothetical protein